MRACVDVRMQQGGRKVQCSKRSSVKYGGSGEAERSASSKCMPHMPAANYNFEAYDHLRLWEQNQK